MTKSDKEVEGKVQRDAAPECPENGTQVNSWFRESEQGNSTNNATQNTTDHNRNQIHMQSNPQRSPKKGREAEITTCNMDISPDDLHNYGQDSIWEK
eukprot:14495051-Ditylum_brightwellii.AAC.1